MKPEASVRQAQPAAAPCTPFPTRRRGHALARRPPLTRPPRFPAGTRERGWRRLAALLLGALLDSPVLALDGATLAIGSVAGADWTAEDVQLTLAFGEPGGISVRLSARSLAMPDPAGLVRDLALECPALEIGGGRVSCPGGSLRALSPYLDGPTATMRFQAARETGEGALHLGGLKFAGGQADLALAEGKAGWQADLAATGLRLERIIELAAQAGLESPTAATGRADLTLAGRGVAGLEALTLALRFRNTALNDGSGLREAQGTGGRFEAAVHASSSGWHGQGRLDLEAGEIYVDPWYLAVDGAPLRLSTRGRWNAATGALTLEGLRLRDGTRLDVEGNLVLRIRPHRQLEHAAFTLPPTPLARIYPVYLQPALQGTALDRLSVTGGTLAAAVDWRPGTLPDLKLELEALDAVDDLGRFSVSGAAGTLDWHRARTGSSRFKWREARFYRLPLGPADLELETGQGRLQLQRPLVIPVLGGALRVEDLKADGIDTESPTGHISILLTPVSLHELTSALGWQPFGGQMSGVIPAIRYLDGALRLEGALLLRVFDGRIVVHDLQLDRPLGPVPRLMAQLSLENLSLEELTTTFAFGRIEGRLEGQISDLVLEDWQPVSFDARFNTPAGDRSRRRVSQRAVNSLASLGGAGGIASRAFMGFFEDFGYARMGISCRLRDRVCQLDGVAPADGGFYIIEGGGLPRIDVVGFNRRVDWSTLVERLQNATRAGPPVVQ